LRHFRAYIFDARALPLPCNAEVDIIGYAKAQSIQNLILRTRTTTCHFYRSAWNADTV